ncbi:heavy metal-associated isoprenylated plant protein 39-like isoform X1 [Glycine soja]|uniref:Heavy metal-associated isoprenylated plant protein 39 n=1 Tax=Glycine soja TaxID=3848 RepID=A0A445F5Z4_GLYSO|nr:heavy metal-associated isoprenylated plant protein 39-like isoform X1 [Glycine soja]RZB44216.1 Heavy metal-associated isoprenylated plant protein 39 [Glycine soja]
MNKVVLHVELHDGKIKKKAMKIVSNLSGVESVSMDMKDQKLTLIGDVDPVVAVEKLRKLCDTRIVSVGPAKEENEGKNNEVEAAENQNQNNLADSVNIYEAYHIHNQYQMRQHHYCCTSVEENPNDACVIC